MLSIYFGDKEGVMDYPKFFFENTFDNGFLTEEFSRKAIKVVDKSDVVDENIIVSPVLGGISPRSLSSGVKNILICRYYPDEIICFSCMGENCLRPLFEEITREGLDRTMCADILYIPYNYGYEGDILILNTSQVVHNGLEFAFAYADWEEAEYDMLCKYRNKEQ